MKLIEREMSVKTTLTDKGENSLFCQASFNSDGVITLRNYNIDDKNSDEIIILSHEETHAIIELLKRISIITKDTLPF